MLYCRKGSLVTFELFIGFVFRYLFFFFIFFISHEQKLNMYGVRTTDIYVKKKFIVVNLFYDFIEYNETQ